MDDDVELASLKGSSYSIEERPAETAGAEPTCM